MAVAAKGKAINTTRFDDLVASLLNCADTVPKGESSVINGVATNVKAIKVTLDNMTSAASVEPKPVPADAQAFLPDKGGYQAKLKAQLHFRSPVLRFALRLTVLMGIGYTGAHFFSDDHYSYWLLLTIVIVARPRLAVTWQRNWQRLFGTFAGVLSAGLLIWMVKDTVVLLVIASIALLGFFVWNRPRYAWSVFCVTICVLLSLSVYRGEVLLLLSTRVWYSLLGCALAIAGIFLFPVWSHAELEELVRQAVGANRAFLAAVADKAAIQEVWLVRKEAHVRLARLSEGIAHARLEPGKGDLSRLEQIQILNYRINAVIISVFLAGRPANVESLRRSLAHLDNFLQGDAADAPKTSGLLKGEQLLEALSQDFE